MTDREREAAVIRCIREYVATVGDVQTYCRHTRECLDRLRNREASDCTCGWAEAMVRLYARGDALVAACEGLQVGR
jgi:hypothetical protein